MIKFVQNKNMLKKNILPLLIAIAILILSLTDSDSFNKINLTHFPHADKIVHLIMYFTLMLSLIYGNRTLLVRFNSFIVLSMIPLIYGVIIEILQKYLTSNRSGELLDAVFDLIGILLAIPVWLLLKKLFASALK